MNRVTRISSAAFGMLLLAGLAYYQSLPDPGRGEEGSLVGTALSKPPVDTSINCENTAGLSEEQVEICAAQEYSNDKN
jgi:hypothetical protein